MHRHIPSINNVDVYSDKRAKLKDTNNQTTTSTHRRCCFYFCFVCATRWYKPNPLHLTLTPNTQHLTPNAQHPTPNTQRLAPNTQHPIPNAQRPTPNAQHPTPNIQRPTPFAGTVLRLRGEADIENVGVRPCWTPVRTSDYDREREESVDLQMQYFVLMDSL